jgi:Tol biopolymer transport system component
LLLGGSFSSLFKKVALLGIFTLLVLMMWAGPASAVENGLIYYLYNGGISSVDPTTPNTQPTFVQGDHNSDSFDISRDGQTLVYNSCSFGFGCGAALYTASAVDGDPYTDATPVEITNLSSSATEITSPKFSPDAQTIYFAGKHILDSDDDTYRIYSVPTNGGEATKIPIDKDNTDSFAYFALSHDGSKLAIGGQGGSSVFRSVEGIQRGSPTTHVRVLIALTSL